MVLAIDVCIRTADKELKMKLVKIFSIAMITLTATASLAATKCSHKETGGRFANTNPPAKTQVAKAVTNTKVGVR